MTDVICPLLSIADKGLSDSYTDCMESGCAWYNPHMGYCAIFSIFDQVADVAQRVDELRDVVESGVKVFNINE